MMCMKRNELLIYGRGNDENYLYATILQKTNAVIALFGILRKTQEARPAEPTSKGNLKKSQDEQKHFIRQPTDKVAEGAKKTN